MSKLVLHSYNVIFPAFDDIEKDDQYSFFVKQLLNNDSLIEYTEGLAERTHAVIESTLNIMNIQREVTFAGWLVSPEGYSLKNLIDGNVSDDFGLPMAVLSTSLKEAIHEASLLHEDYECVLLQYVICSRTDDESEIDEDYHGALEAVDVRVPPSDHIAIFDEFSVYAEGESGYDLITKSIYDAGESDRMALSDYYKARMNLLEL